MSEPSERLRVPQERRPGRNPIGAIDEGVGKSVGVGPLILRASEHFECLMCGYGMTAGGQVLSVPYDSGWASEYVCADCVLEAAELIRKAATGTTGASPR